VFGLPRVPPAPAGVGKQRGAAPDAAPSGPHLDYLPALDGVRAFAVLGVMAFHSGLPFLPAGFLGVDSFFVLSGFLITSLLTAEWASTGTIRLRAFWARRARRLLPALLLVIVFVALWSDFVAAKGSYPDLRWDALSALFYVANWHFIAAGGNYFVQTGPASPLTHTWSLAIEEQFYLIWPLIVLGLLRWTKDLRVLLAVAGAGAIASAVEMALLFRSGTDLTRLYYGTDTHAQCLLVGAAVALGWAVTCGHRRGSAGDAPPLSAATRRAVGAAGAVGVLGTGVLWWRTSYAGAFLWEGGFLVAALATAAVVVAATAASRSMVSRALGWAPLRFLGRISYGLYLWHFPLFQWLDAERTGLRGYPLFGVRFGATVGMATASFYLVERPIRHGGALRRWRAWIATPVAFAGVASLVVLTTAGGVGVAAGAPPSLPPARTTSAPTASASGPPGPATTVLLLGDSTAVTLGFGLGVEAQRYHATLVNQAIIECGVAEVTDVETGQSVEPPGPACRPTTPPAQQWPAIWQTAVDRYQPQVVAILVGRWEVSNVRWDGGWTDILAAPFASYVRKQLQLAVDVASSQGAHVDLLTAPCYDSGEQPDGNPWPADSPARLAAYNDIVRSVGAANPSVVSVVDLDAVVCPGGHFVANEGETPIRAPDGVHFPWFTVGQPNAADPDTLAEVDRFGAWLGPRLWPKLLSTGR